MQDLRKGAKTGSNALIFQYKGGSGQKNRRRGLRRRKGRDTIYCVFPLSVFSSDPYRRHQRAHKVDEAAQLFV